MSTKIKRANGVPKFLEPAAKSINEIIDLHRRGLLVGSDSVTVEPLPDGRYRLKISPRLTTSTNVTGLVGAGGGNGGGGGSVGNMFVIA